MTHMTTCNALHTFLRARHGRACLSALTGQDAAALATFVHAANLYTRADHEGAARAEAIMAHAALAMQPHNRWLAYEAIGYALDFSQQRPLWHRLQLSDVDVPTPLTKGS